jgi:uncharacterized RDD family membrane protein YckC
MKTRLFLLLATLVAWSASALRADTSASTSTTTVTVVEIGSPDARAKAPEGPPTPAEPSAPPAAATPASPEPVAPSVPEAPKADPAEPTSPAPADIPAGPTVPSEPPAEAAAPQRETSSTASTSRRTKRQPEMPPLVAFNRDITLGADDHRAAVVVIGGSATVEGKVDDAVVVIGGDVIARGPVGEAVVAILGNVTLDAPAAQAVAVGGGVELGPEADVQEVVSIGGPIDKAETARVSGSMAEVAFTDEMPDYSGLRAWVRHAFFLGRPLAFHPDLVWAWMIAMVVLGLYMLIGLLFPRPISSCVETLEERPGGTLLAALLAGLLSPVLTVLLAVTIVGPVVFMGAMLLAVLMGKTALLAWVGRRTLGGMTLGTPSRTVAAVALGGGIVALLYTVPFLGAFLWHLSVGLGFGLASYTAIRSLRSSNGAPAASTPSAGGSAGFAASAPSAASLSDAAAPSPSGMPSPDGSATAEPPVVPPSGAGGSAALVLAVPSALPRAGFWPRMLALAIDTLIVLVVSSAVYAEGSLSLVLLAGYGAVMWRFRGTTIGGIVFGIKVVRLDDRPVDWPTAIVRALASFLSLFAAGLGFLWIIWDPERQAWHDKIAGTVVVRVPRGVSLV